MPAAFYVDLVWQMAVRFDFYEDYCDFISGGYIERFDVISKEMHKMYRKGYIKYMTKGFFLSLNPCPCFWPELKEFNDFELEYSTCHLVHIECVPRIKRFIHNELIHKESKIGPEIFRQTIMSELPNYVDLLKDMFSGISKEPAREINIDNFENLKEYIKND